MRYCTVNACDPVRTFVKRAVRAGAYMAVTAGITDHGHRRVFLSLLPPMRRTVVWRCCSYRLDRDLPCLCFLRQSALAAIPGFIRSVSRRCHERLADRGLLYGSIRSSGRRALLLLATAYLFTAPP